MSATSTSAREFGQKQRKTLLNLKCLFWCLHERRQSYNLNLVLHSLERRAVHADIANSHLGDNLEFLLRNFGDEDVEKIQSALREMARSRSSVDVGEKHFEIGHYVQADYEFGPIAEGSCGIICATTPQLRGLFCLDDAHLMEAPFAPSDARLIFGTFIQ